MNYSLRKAELGELPLIWEILQGAILRRKMEGSRQWQDGYPNAEVILEDIKKGAGFVLADQENRIAVYVAILFNDEPAYEELMGKWLTNGNFLVMHRIAVSEQHLGKGLVKKMLHFAEELAVANKVYSIKVDTNFDNAPMLAIFGKLGYMYCGEVVFRGGIRMAFEKVLNR